MSENFVVEIISPDKSILKSDAHEVIIPSYEGQMGILKNHVPLITFLRPGFINIKKDNEEIKFFVEEGTIEFLSDNLIILTSTCESLDNLNSENVKEIISKSQKKINQNEISDKEKYLLSHKIEALSEIS
tara:strand:+ start:1197 stop:1586 length:390 start_codon:yes stop_codon:yes gene_type:complete